MAWTVKEVDANGFPGAISLGRLVSVAENGQQILEERIFLPGETVPDEYMEAYTDRMGEDPDDHLWSLLETDGKKPAAKKEEPAPAADDEDEDESYDSWSVDDLKAEVEERGVEVEGSGAGGNVLKADLVAALEQHDQGRENPFT